MSKKVSDIYIPTPRLMSSGNYYIQLRVGGRSIAVKEKTAAKCRAKARAIKLGIIESKPKETQKTLGVVVDSYIESKSSVLSPSTIRAYRAYRRNRFVEWWNLSTDTINYQKMINSEVKLGVSPKTIYNAWHLVSAALGDNAPKVTLPSRPRNERPFLTAEQIPIFIEAVRGQPCELAALLALHSLRYSELRALKRSDIYDGCIHVHGAVVKDEYSIYVHKKTNKNQSSTRTIPIFIPRIYDLIDETDYVVPYSQNKLYSDINRICKKCELPPVGIHGLRHSFASLAVVTLSLPDKVVMQLGGWSTRHVLDTVYTHVSTSNLINETSKIASFFADNAHQNAK